MTLDNIIIAFSITNNGQTKQVQIPVMVDTETTLLHIKQALAAKLKVATWQLKLELNRVELKDSGKPLVDYGIPNNAVLQLLMNIKEMDAASIVNEFTSAMPVTVPYC
ncbi:hypothetical protein IWW43_001470 [Coemansia sp. RSA 1935]|nr:hypothetical protein IWW43_001470 [Coemansia sp. RSA 1935]